MSSSEPPIQPPSDSKDAASRKDGASGEPPSGTTEMDTTPDEAVVEETWEDLPDDVKGSSTDEVMTRMRLIDNDIKVCMPAFHIGKCGTYGVLVR